MPAVVAALKPRDLPELNWVNTAMSNLKTTLSDTFHSLDFCKHARNYPAAFTHHFNKRFDLPGIVARLIINVAH
jgi:hypothetical protein